MAVPNLATGHTCPPPTPRSDRHWWTCPLCGQMWRRDPDTGFWKLTAREEQ